MRMRGRVFLGMVSGDIACAGVEGGEVSFPCVAILSLLAFVCAGFVCF